MYIRTLVFIQGCRAASQDEVCVVTIVSAFLIITELSSGLKKSNFLNFSKCKYLHVKMASLATVKSCVTIGPIL